MGYPKEERRFSRRVLHISLASPASLPMPLLFAFLPLRPLRPPRRNRENENVTNMDRRSGIGFFAGYWVVDLDGPGGG